VRLREREPRDHALDVPFRRVARREDDPVDDAFERPVQTL
jgi:hypothetical protein